MTAGWLSKAALLSAARPKIKCLTLGRYQRISQMKVALFWEKNCWGLSDLDPRFWIRLWKNNWKINEALARNATNGGPHSWTTFQESIKICRKYPSRNFTAVLAWVHVLPAKFKFDFSGISFESWGILNFSYSCIVKVENVWIASAEILMKPHLKHDWPAKFVFCCFFVRILLTWFGVFYELIRILSCQLLETKKHVLHCSLLLLVCGPVLLLHFELLSLSFWRRFTRVEAPVSSGVDAVGVEQYNTPVPHQCPRNRRERRAAQVERPHGVVLKMPILVNNACPRKNPKISQLPSVTSLPLQIQVQVPRGLYADSDTTLLHFKFAVPIWL